MILRRYALAIRCCCFKYSGAVMVKSSLLSGPQWLPLGVLANAASVRIGGKAVGSGGQNDQFHEDLDSVLLRIVR